MSFNKYVIISINSLPVYLQRPFIASRVYPNSTNGWRTVERTPVGRARERPLLQREGYLLPTHLYLSSKLSRICPRAGIRAFSVKKGTSLFPFLPFANDRLWNTCSRGNIKPKRQPTVILHRDGTAFLAKIFIHLWNFSLLYCTKITRTIPLAWL